MSSSLKSIKPTLRDLLAEGLLLSSISKPNRCANNKLTIVTFHRVLPEELRQKYPYPGICVTPEELRWFCKFFNQFFTINVWIYIYFCELCSFTN